MRPPEIYLSTSAPLYRAFVRRAEPPSARLITQRSQVRILPPLLSKRPSDIGPGAVCTAGVADSDQPGLAEYSMPRWSLTDVRHMNAVDHIVVRAVQDDPLGGRPDREALQPPVVGTFQMPV